MSRKYKQLSINIKIPSKLGTTLGLSVETFADLYDGPIWSASKTGTDECPGYCLLKDELRPCPARCECAYVRDVSQILRRWEKARKARLSGG